jgi:hypothetical protein
MRFRSSSQLHLILLVEHDLESRNDATWAPFLSHLLDLMIWPQKVIIDSGFSRLHLLCRTRKLGLHCHLSMI